MMQFFRSSLQMDILQSANITSVSVQENISISAFFIWPPTKYEKASTATTQQEHHDALSYLRNCSFKSVTC